MNFVALPSDVQILIQSLAIALVTVAINFVIGRVPFLKFLAAYAQEWGLLLGGLLIDTIQNVLPTGSDDVSIKGIVFLLALIGMIVKFAKARGVRGLA